MNSDITEGIWVGLNGEEVRDYTQGYQLKRLFQKFLQLMVSWVIGKIS